MAIFLAGVVINFFLDSLLKGYEFISYDSRIARTAGVSKCPLVLLSLTLIIHPLDLLKSGLGEYLASCVSCELINTVSSGNPKALS